MAVSSFRTGLKTLSLLAGNPATALGVAGYVAGGTNGPPLANVEKYLFATETTTTLAAEFTTALGFVGGMSNPSVAGYTLGGDLDTGGANDYVDTVHKYAFPDDTRTTLATGLSAGLRGVAGFSDPSVAGYAAGGNNNAQGQTDSVDKFSFPSDTRTSTTTLSNSVRFLATFSDPSVAGYAAGGGVADVDKFAFPTDSRTTLATGLSITRDGAAGFSDPGVAGYAAGGRNSDTDVVDKFSFPTDSRTTLATGLSSTTYFAAAFAQPQVAGYVAGGDDGAPTTLSKVDKFTFPTDTRSSGTSLSTPRTTAGPLQDA